MEEDARVHEFDMDGLKPPAQWDMDASNLAKSWKSWKEFILYMARALPDADKTGRLILFQYLIGECGRELCHTPMSGVSTANRTVDCMIARFDEHCTTKISDTAKIYNFFCKKSRPK